MEIVFKGQQKKMTNLKTALTISIFLIILVLLSYFLWPQIRENFEEKEPILARISLENRCSFRDEVFVIEDQSSGRKAQFKNGNVSLKVLKGTMLKLGISPLYPDFRYDGLPQEAEPEMTFIADCSASPRMQMIMDSMKESFN